MPRSPLTETINKVNGMVHYVQENLSADEYLLFLDYCVPEPEPEVAKPAKKKSRKLRGKSVRAAGMAETLNRSLRQQRAITASTDCEMCDYDSDHNIHHLESMVGYHPFVAPSTAPAADNQSSASNGAGSTTASSVDKTVSAVGVPAGLSDSEKALV